MERLSLCEAAISQEYFDEIYAKLTDEQRQALEAARERARKALASPHFSKEAMQARVAAAAKWEEENGEVSAFCGQTVTE
jgi:Spy/CpxP family protein refolding chaperone